MFLKKCSNVNIDGTESNLLLFIADIKKKIASHAERREMLPNQDRDTIADPDWSPDSSGVHVVEHIGIHELDEQTQNQMMRFIERHEAHQDRLRDTQRLEIERKSGASYDTVRVKALNNLTE